METLNKRQINDGYKIIGTVVELTAESDNLYTRPGATSTSYSSRNGHDGIYDFEAPVRPALKFKYLATISTKLGNISLPVSKDFADEMSQEGALGSTVEINIVRK